MRKVIWLSATILTVAGSASYAQQSPDVAVNVCNYLLQKEYTLHREDVTKGVAVSLELAEVKKELEELKKKLSEEKSEKK